MQDIGATPGVEDEVVDEDKVEVLSLLQFGLQVEVFNNRSNGTRRHAGKVDVSQSYQNHAANIFQTPALQLEQSQLTIREQQARIQQLERRLAELERDKGQGSFVTGKSQENGLFANIQVAAFPFQRNFGNLPEVPSEFYLEVGSNSRNVMQDDTKMKAAFARGAFLITFEPLIDKYAQLLTRYDGGQADHRRQLGLQHEHGLVLPFAVGCSGSAAFHVAQVDGCSSVLPMRGSAFGADPKSAKWPAWVKDDCAKDLEQRTVPCVSLEQVIGDWLGGKDVAHIKIDAQGFDLNVVKSAGKHVEKLKSVHMEVQCDSAAMIYVDQPNCTSVYTEMSRLGFQTRFDPASCKTCTEANLDFHRI